MDKGPNCYECKYRGPIPGNCHSQCLHPKVDNVRDGAVALASMFGGERLGIGPTPNKLNVTGNPHGIKNGWFLWPFNFDPLWLESCDGWEPIPLKPNQDQLDDEAILAADERRERGE